MKKKIMEECKMAGLRMPTWSQGKGEVLLTFHAPKITTSKDNSILSDAVSTIDDVVNNVIIDAVKTRLILVIKLLYIEGPLTLKTLMNSLNVSRATIQRDLRLLTTHHFLRLMGSDKYREYTLNEALKKKFDALKYSSSFNIKQ